ncbi:polysaccharide biosynthesis protein [Lentzea sp. NBRC 105346]|uniref:lipopolysaccharide biosynthesis protein n=1 Tax=Lentzea sp. NBRC 105346 TaxID=3032205 RepID=UPI0024A2B6AC|nr:lipopolysaccharide biosynthesis protein [Lentzea sp. NBRC 105346]GLZ28899.1 polysaccharide biosynthesis protein [Lentzea sp. NBRC 105346]
MTLDEREAHSEVGTIGRKAGRGLRWSLLGTLATKAGSFAMGLVLARLLTPSDFGMYAVALAATQFVMHVNDVGIIAATVQWRGRLEEMAATATTMAIVFSTGVYAIFWFLAPAFASLSGSPEATGVVRLLTAVILIDGITAVRSGTLLRRFEQDKIMMANAAGFVVNATLAITLAANGAGPYSFAIGQLSASVVTGVIVWFRAAIPVHFGWDRPVVRRLLKFGIPLAASLGVESVLLNADYVIVGDLLGPEALGYYLLAFNVSSWVPGLIGTAVRWVSIPSFSRLAENDETDTLSVGVQRSVPLLIAVVLPLAVLMATLAHPMIALLYGAQWDQAAGVLRFLAVLMVGRMLTSLAFDILTSTGNTRATVWLNLAWAVVLVPVLYYATSTDGIRGASIGHAVVVTVVALPLAVLVLHRAGVRLWPMWPRLVRPVLGGVLSGLVILVVARLLGPGVLLPLVVAGGAGSLVYAVIVLPQILAARKEKTA